MGFGLVAQTERKFTDETGSSIFSNMNEVSLS